MPRTNRTLPEPLTSCLQKGKRSCKDATKCVISGYIMTFEIQQPLSNFSCARKEKNLNSSLAEIRKCKFLFLDYRIRHLFKQLAGNGSRLPKTKCCHYHLQWNLSSAGPCQYIRNRRTSCKEMPASILISLSLLRHLVSHRSCAASLTRSTQFWILCWSNGRKFPRPNRGWSKKGKGLWW